MEALLFIILYFLTTFWLLNSIPKLEPVKGFHISFSFPISPFNLKSSMICSFPWKSTFPEKCCKCKGRGITKLQGITYWKQSFWGIGEDKYIYSSDNVTEKLHPKQQSLRSRKNATPRLGHQHGTSMCASAQFRDTGRSLRDGCATAGNHVMNVQFWSFHSVSAPCALNTTKCFSIPYKRQNSYRKGYNYRGRDGAWGHCLYPTSLQ